MRKMTALAQVCKEFRRYGLEVLGLSEIRWLDAGERRTSSGEFLLYSGPPESEGHHRGVGFLLTANSRKSIIDWKPVSDRIITARFSSHPKNVTMIQVYAPTNAASMEDKDSFYDLLETTLDQVPRADITILLGDLNAKVGANNSSWEKVMGKHGLGTMNENGALLVELCDKYNLVIGGTLFPHKEIHKYTWTHPDPALSTRNQIDHIAISQKWKTSLEDVRNKRGANVYTDHILLVGCLRLKMFRRRRTAACAAKRLNMDGLRNAETAQRFKEQMREEVTNIGDNQNAEARWDALQRAFNRIGTEVLGTKSNERKEWISDHTWNLIGERIKLKHTFLTAQTEVQRREAMEAFNEMERQVGRSARKDKRDWFEALANEAQQAADHHNMRETFRIAKRLTAMGQPAKHLIRARDGRLLMTEEEQAERWSEHFEEVLNKTPSTSPRSPIGAPTSRTFNIRPPSRREIVNAIKRLKNNKAPGADNISPEMLKVDLDSISSQLESIIREVWENESVPTHWKDGRIIKLPKKGNLTLCTNWRGITLLNTVNKVMSIILHDRLSSVLEPTLRREQAGFRPGRSCTDHINTLRIIVEQSIEWQSPIFLLFIDFERAFDSLDREMMWKVLASYGIPDKLLNIIQSMYRDANCRIVHRGLLGREFNVASGVKQGCILSPLLFLLVMDWVMNKVNKTSRGIGWQHVRMTRLEDLDFADDICMMSHTRSGIAEKLNQLVRYGKQVGLRINVTKSKLMCVNPQTGSFPLIIDGEQIDEVESYCYLGSIISRDGGAGMCVANRIKKARQAFGMLNALWNSNRISRKLKLRFFRSNVLSVLLYGSETWKTTSSITQSLQVFVNKCLRRILRVRWPEVISNEELLRTTRSEPVELVIRRRKWRWIGHVLRRNDIAKEALDWNPQGRRKQGRPKDTWRRSIDREAAATNTTWLQIRGSAQNRTRWRAIVDALCATEA